MIQLIRLNGASFYLNSELIEQIESTPDTVITLTTGNNFVVRNSLRDVIDKIIHYRQTVAEQKSERTSAWISQHL